MSRTPRFSRIARALAAALLIAAGLAWSSLVIVDESEFVIVTDFGRARAIYGDRPGEAGAHWKAPWQRAIKIDRRLRVLGPPAREVMTGDKRNLEVAPYVVWQVSDPSRFLRGAVSHELAEARLSERVSAALSDAIGRMELADLASTETGARGLDALTRSVLSAVAPSARDELGVEVRDVRLRRFNHPLEVRPAVFDLIRSERRRVASRLRAEGEAEYLAITSRADRERDVLLARAEADARRVRAEGEAEAVRLLNEAHARAPRFFEFLRTLESYGSILDERATVVLSTSGPLLKLLVDGPADEAPGKRAETEGANAGAGTIANSVDNANQSRRAGSETAPAEAVPSSRPARAEGRR